MRARDIRLYSFSKWQWSCSCEHDGVESTLRECAFYTHNLFYELFKHTQSFYGYQFIFKMNITSHYVFVHRFKCAGRVDLVCACFWCDFCSLCDNFFYLLWKFSFGRQVFVSWIASHNDAKSVDRTPFSRNYSFPLDIWMELKKIAKINDVWCWRQPRNKMLRANEGTWLFHMDIVSTNS